jgi:hypothetical protein
MAEKVREEPILPTFTVGLGGNEAVSSKEPTSVLDPIVQTLITPKKTFASGLS